MKSIVLFASIVLVSSIAMAQAPLQSSASPPAIANPLQSSVTPPADSQAGEAPEQASEPVGKGSGLWEWTPYEKYHDTIVEVSTEHGSGTGVLIRVDKSKEIKGGYEGLVLTAWHVVQDDAVDGKIKVTYRSKRRARGCQVVEHDEAKDVALLWVWVPKGIEPAELATASVKRGDKLELVGLGGGTKLADCVRCFRSEASPPSTIEKIFADVPLLPGDSGGPVFNSKHQVVGIISGGWFWWDSGLKTESGAYIRTTWPARASNVGPLQTMLTKVDSNSIIASSKGQSADTIQR